MSLGNAAGSEQRVEERVVLIPSAWHRMMPMALLSHSVPPWTPQGRRCSSQWLFGWPIHNTSGLPSWVSCLWQRAGPRFLPSSTAKLQFGASFTNYFCCSHNLAKFLAARCSQGLKVVPPSIFKSDGQHLFYASYRRLVECHDTMSGIMPRVFIFALQPYYPSLGTTGFFLPPLRSLFDLVWVLLVLFTVLWRSVPFWTEPNVSTLYIFSRSVIYCGELSFGQIWYSGINDIA